MDPKRKRIYLIIIAGCILLSAGLLLYRSSGPRSSQVYIAPTVPIAAGIGDSNPKVPSSSTSGNISGDPKSGYSAPAVFPANSNFDVSVLNSSSFKQLKKYDAIKLDPTLLGRDDPFKNY